MSPPPTRFVRDAMIPPAPPPRRPGGPLARIRRTLFGGVGDALTTLLILAALAWIVPAILRFLLLDAVWTGDWGAACRPEVVGRPVGACWAFIGAKINYLVYGSYPAAERWRPNLFFALLGLGAAWMLWLGAPRRDLGAWFVFLVLPVASWLLLSGMPAFGLATVATALWGGILVTLVVSAVGLSLIHI